MDREPPEYLLKVTHGLFSHEVKVPSTATFGDLKQVLVEETQLQPAEQRLLFRGKYVPDEEPLFSAGVRDRTKLILVENDGARDKKVQEQQGKDAAAKALQAIAAARAETDEYAAEITAAGMELAAGRTPDDRRLSYLGEMLVRQMLKLDGVEAEGDVKLQRKAEVVRCNALAEEVDRYRNLLSSGGAAAQQARGAPSPSSGQPLPEPQPQASAQESPLSPPLSGDGGGGRAVAGGMAIISDMWENFDTNGGPPLPPAAASLSRPWSASPPSSVLEGVASMGLNGGPRTQARHLGASTDTLPAGTGSSSSQSSAAAGGGSKSGGPRGVGAPQASGGYQGEEGPRGGGSERGSWRGVVAAAGPPFPSGSGVEGSRPAPLPTRRQGSVSPSSSGPSKSMPQDSRPALLSSFPAAAVPGIGASSSFRNGSRREDDVAAAAAARGAPESGGMQQSPAPMLSSFSPEAVARPPGRNPHGQAAGAGPNKAAARPAAIQVPPASVSGDVSSFSPTALVSPGPGGNGQLLRKRPPASPPAAAASDSRDGAKGGKGGPSLQPPNDTLASAIMRASSRHLSSKANGMQPAAQQALRALPGPAAEAPATRAGGQGYSPLLAPGAPPPQDGRDGAGSRGPPAGQGVSPNEGAAGAVPSWQEQQLLRGPYYSSVYQGETYHPTNPFAAHLPRGSPWPMSGAQQPPPPPPQLPPISPTRATDAAATSAGHGPSSAAPADSSPPFPRAAQPGDRLSWETFE